MSDFNTPALDAWNEKVSTPDKMFHEIERLRSKARHDEAQALHNVEKKKALEIAREMLLEGDSVEKVMRCTGSTHEEVEDVKRRLFQ